MKKPTVQTKKGYKALSLLLAAIMILSEIPAVSLSAFAETLGSVIVQLSGGSAQRHTVANYQSAYASSTYRYGMANYAVPMDGTNGNPDVCVPGLSSTDDMVPQGLSYWAAKNRILISAYHNGGSKASCIYALDADTGRLVAQFNLKNASNGNITDHVSGIACSANNLYVASTGSTMSYIPLSQLDVAEGTVTNVQYSGSVDLNLELNNANTSYASFGDGILWTGNFYIANDSTYGTKANANSGSMLLGYDLTGFADSASEWAALQGLVGNPSYCIPLDPYGINKVQCATVKNGFCYVGTSYGRTNDSQIHIFNVNLGSTIGNMTVNGHTKPAILLTNQRTYAHLPMTEGLMIYDGYLWNIFESAAYLYNGQGDLSKNPTDVLWRFDISSLLEIDRENDDEEAATGDDQFKAANVSCGELSFVVPEVIYLTPTTNNSSSFQYYANNSANGSVVSTYGTSGKIYYSYAGASSATLSWKFYNENLSKELTGGSVTLSSATISSGNTGVEITGGTSPSVSNGGSSYIEWALTYTDSNDGKTKTAYAYSFVYKPYVSPVGAASFVYDKTAGHKDVQLSLISWWTGVQGTTGTRPSFTSIGTPDDGSVRKYPNTKADNATYYLNPLIEGVKSNPDNIDATNYLNANGNKGLDQTIRYNTFYKYNGGNKWITTATTGDYAFIYADSSRIDNLNKLPNYKFSTLLTDDMATSSSMNYLINKTTSYYDGGANDDSKKHSVYSSDGDTSITSGSYGSSTEGYYYNAAYSVAIPNSTGSMEFGIESAFEGKRDDGWLYKIGYVCAATYCPIRVVYVNKGSLRTAVQNATKQMARLGVNGASHGKLTSLYFKSDSDYRWVAFQHAYKNAVMALTRLDGSNDQALIDALNNALDALCTHVTYDYNGGTVTGTTETAYVTVGTSQTGTVTPGGTGTRIGYTFDGWSTSSTATSGSDSVTVGYNNTVYAVWKPISYTVAYDGNGATGGSTASSTHTYDAAKNLTANGFSRQYTVSYNGNEGTPAVSSNVASYTFAGWQGSKRLISDTTEYSRDYTSGDPNSTTDYKNIKEWTISAPFAANEKYVLEFDAKGSGKITNYFYGNSGYWPIARSESGDGLVTTGSDGDIRQTLTSNYNHYKVTWTLAASGNSNVDKKVLFRVFGGNSVTFKNVVFYKETGSVDYTNQQSVTNLCSVAGEVYQMRAKWTAASVTLPSATRTGYTFAGWYTAASGGTRIGDAGDSYTPTASITLYAHWTINKYTITFKNGTTTLQSSDWDYGSTPIYSGNTPTKAYDSTKHYTFSGWSPAIVPVTEAATYTAQFTGTNHSYTSSVTTPPTCTGAGVTTYTCSCGYSYTDSIPAAIGHIWNYAGAVFNWSGYACPNATVTCTRNSSHIATVTTTVTSSTTNATCTVDGSTVYTATFTVDGTTYADTKTKTIPALGHDYEWVADGSDSHNAIHRCTRGDFSETVTVTRDDTCILDFGVGSLIPVLNNDADGAEPDGVTENMSVYNASFSNGEIAFVPQTILSGKITIPYTVTYEGVTCSANVLVIPASNVYLEESYFDFDDENATAKWQTANAEYQQAFDNGDAPGEADSPVNFVPEYNAENSSTYSMGSAKYVTVDKTHTGAKVSFSFTGTGFDLYSVTSGATGVAVVTVTGTKKTTDETTQEETLLVDEHLIVSTYFGYAYGKLYLTTKDGQDVVTLTPTDRPLYYLPAGVTGGYSISGSRRGTDDPNAADKNDNDEPIEAYGWVAGENNVGSLYQVPVISCTDMEYDRYTVVVQPRYAKMYDAAGTNRYDFYVDSVRIYDPIDPDTVEADSEIANAYKAANEYKTEYQELRKILIDANSFRAEQETETVQDPSETPVYGVALLERGGDVTSIDVYEDVGPKNEVYLRNNQAVAFHITTSGSVIPAKLCIGMKLVQGEDEGTVLVNGTPITVDCATELYRDISNCVQWEGTAGAYKTKDPIVIWNTSGEGKIISLTKLKWSYGGTRAAQVVQAPARSLKFSFSRSALDTLDLTAQNEGGGTLDASAVTVTWNKDTFELGETATLTITAPATFMRAFVDGEEIAGYTELDNGMRQWTYQVTAEELGLFPADVTLEDANEYRTGALKAPQLTATEPTVELIESAIAWGSDDIMLGEAALLTVTVPAKVVSVTVNGETVTLFDLNEDGSKVFTWTVTPETAGEHVFKVTAAEGHGYASDEILTPALTVNEPAPEEPGNGSQSGSWSLRHLVDAILNFFRKILNMFKIKA